ncbi:hypothetical protein CKM354_000484000 [Cercospora kikuchii]|uniref:Uncharacterized protein n=1 Tax=Cercospora kikuchii TaxID=84275 RepID=A0A9P3CEP1_9PEZI|nr:uncharacterized protein CKM354_000484000 [Cercospora kikuchii]GIZ41539.1 hypothetical protein CKM354_000484000 [Cercospora kikuchii]
MASRLQSSYRRTTSLVYVERLSSSWILPTSVLAAIRAFISLYVFVVQFFIIGYRCSTGRCDTAGRSFSYFTGLGYWGLGFYYAFAAAHTFSYAFRGKPWLSSWPAWLRWLHSVLYASITIFSFIVTAVYWAGLNDKSFTTPFRSWSNISQHALNSVFAFSEIVLPRSDPHPWINVLSLVFLGCCYIGLAYLTHATQGFYVYDFLDPNENGSGSVVGYCIGILAACVILFVVVRYAQWARRWLTEVKFSRGAPQPHHDTAPRSAEKSASLEHESDQVALSDTRRHDV